MMKKNSLYIKMGLVLLSGMLVALLLYFGDSQRQLVKNEAGQSMIKRHEKGSKGHEEELIVDIGDEKKDITVAITGQEYTSEELDQLFEDAKEKLEAAVLGENENLDEVRSRLHLVNIIPDTNIRVAWELDNYEVMNLQGELQTDKLTDEGILVKLLATLSYEDKLITYEFYACVYPPKMASIDKQVKLLDKELAERDKNTRMDAWLVLPEKVAEQQVKWSYPKDTGALGIAFLGAVAAGLIFLSEKEKRRNEIKKRRWQMFIDYPQVIGKFTLFLGAGMPPRKTWFKIAEEYLMQKEEIGTRYIYEEMVRTMYEIQGGTSEGECYERFGRRCGISHYRKFAAILSQNLRKGTKGIAQLLKSEAEDAFEERKNLAKKLGEEASAKLLLPMFLMLGIVMIIIVVPAFLTIQV